MKQFGKVLKFELKNHLTNKGFVGVTVFLVVVIAVVMFIPRITGLFRSEDEGTDVPADLPVMLVQTDGSTPGGMVKETFSAAFPGYIVQLSEDGTDTIRDKITSGEIECAFALNGLTSYTYYVNNLTMFDDTAAVADAVLRDLYRVNAMLNGGMTEEQVSDVMNVVIEGSVESLGKDQAQNFFYTYIMIFALYMVIILYGNMVSTSVATEKSSRAMELLITSADPPAMMFGKVIAACLAGLIQLVLIFGSAVLFYGINKSAWGGNEIVSAIFDIPVPLLAYMAVFFILGFLIYAFLFGAIASTVSKLEDVGTANMPIMYLFIFGFMAVVFSMSSGAVDNTLMKVCSYVPFTSPMAMFTRIAMSTVPAAGIAASIALLVLSTVGIGFLSARIYRVGVLMYGTPPRLSAILKSIRKAK